MSLRIVCLLAVCAGFACAQEPVVTETRWVNSGQSRQLLRKINGQWWSRDNILVNPPGKGGFFWTLSSKPGVVDFHHHRPFQIQRAEWLNLFMPADDVLRVLGPPNTVFRMGTDSAFYRYYAEDGTSLSVRIMRGVVGEAEYRKGGKEWPVASVAQQLGGRSIYALLADRASGKAVLPVVTAAAPAAAAPAAPATPPRRTVIAPEAMRAVAAGDARETVIQKLGEPSFRSSMTTDEGVRESLTYHLEDGKTVVFRVVNGKVVQTP